ncbi:hypothetical protein PR048_032400 [Dryococelus australis]|uniref:DUF4371 domain-containing protein n=1 Tax=Dryococelus australis TaxID=614101 RepID=A0ABQ9G229_9NEOP|nr:hypothetical protein PR048_032400 [Dryococelus australis]
MKLETIAARNRCQSACEWQTLKFSRQKKYFLLYMKHPISQKRDCLLLLNMFIIVSICHFKISEDNDMMVGATRVQKIIRERQRKAQYYHCANHSLNIALQDCVKNISLLRDCMQWVQEIATDFDLNETHYQKTTIPHTLGSQSTIYYQCDQLLFSNSSGFAVSCKKKLKILQVKYGVYTISVLKEKCI